MNLNQNNDSRRPQSVSEEQNDESQGHENEEGDNWSEMSVQNYIVIVQNLFAMMSQINVVNDSEYYDDQQQHISNICDWRSDEIEFFDSHLDASMSTEDIIQFRKNTYYWNVYLFIDRIKDIASI